jgi:hypothetical protein
VSASGSCYLIEKFAKERCCCPYFKPLDDKFVEQAVTTTNSASMHEVMQVYLTTVLKLNGTWRLLDITPCQVTPLGFMWLLLFLHRALCGAIPCMYYAFKYSKKYGTGEFPRRFV